MSPYRNFLDEARPRLAQARSLLGTRARALGAVRRLLPRGLRRELERLERALELPLRNPRDVELRERGLAEYEERLEVAIAFSDHVLRDRSARWRRQRTWFRWLAAGTASAVACLAALVVLGPLFLMRAQADEIAAPACHLGASELAGSSPGASDAQAMANPCGLSVECARHGRCTTVADGCSVSHSDDCRASWDCKIDGLCQQIAGRCSAENDLDCAASRACRRDGRCKADDGVCVSAIDWAERAAPRPELAQGGPRHN